MPDPPTTQNHDLPLVPPVGDENADDYESEWGDILNDSGWSQLEQLLVARDVESNRTEYESYDNAIFWATDTGAVYVGDGSEWSLRDAEFASLALSSLVISGDITTDTGDTIWDSTTDSVPTDSLSDDSVTVADNTVSLGGSVSVDHADLSLVSDDDHHSYPVPNSGLVNDSVGVAGNSVDLGESISVAHADLSAVSDDDHHSYPVPNSGLVNDSVSVAGNSVSLGESTSVAHADLSSVSDDDHHDYPVPNEGLVNDSVSVAGNSVNLGESTTIAHGDLSAVSDNDHHDYPVPNEGLVNDSVSVAGNSVDLGGSVSIAHADISSVSDDDHHSYPVPNTGLVNDSVTVAGNSVDLGGSTAIEHADIDGVGADDHHVAHEHPGDRAAESDLNMSDESITNVSEISGDYATHSFDGTSYNIDLEDSDADARYRTTASDTIIWFRETGNVEIPTGRLDVSDDVRIDGSSVAIDGDEQPPESHGNQAHDETYAVDGDEQPPESHDNTAHSEDYATQSDLEDVEGEPAGSDNDLQVNDNGSFGTAGSVTYDSDEDGLAFGNFTVSYDSNEDELHFNHTG